MTALQTRTRIGLAALSLLTFAAATSIAAPAGETVAAFIDREYGTSVLTGSKWNVQGNDSTASGWTDHFTAGSQAVFQPSLAGISPGGPRSYSRFGLRMAPGSSTGATVTIPTGQEVSSSKAASFRMRVVSSNSDICGSASFGSSANFVVGGESTSGNPTFGTMLSAPKADKSQIALPVGLPISDAGAATYLCYEFSLPLPIPSGLSNGDTATVRWTFDAVSS